MALPDWAGAQVCILASGPSLTTGQCQIVQAWREAESTARVIVINNTFELAPWADLLYACDATWWRMHIAQVRLRFHGELWTQDEAARLAFGVRHVPSVRAPGLGVNGAIHQGGNGGYQAINLAFLAGASRIVLLGFDMHGTHWHGSHPPGLSNPPPWLFAQWIKHFEALSTDLRSRGVPVVNCSPGSALRAFDTSTLEAALSHDRHQHHPARTALPQAGL